MMFGTGVDIVQISRIQAAYHRNKSFVERILGLKEQTQYRQIVQAKNIAYLASRFAAKEACGKALGLGISKIMTWHAVQILSVPQKPPILHYSESLAAWLQQHHLTLHLSLSHEREYVVAFANAWQTSAGN